MHGLNLWVKLGELENIGGGGMGPISLTGIGGSGKQVNIWWQQELDETSGSGLLNTQLLGITAGAVINEKCSYLLSVTNDHDKRFYSQKTKCIYIFTMSTIL